ncbi:hypothetical protein [Candidatus Amarolinea dominans]|uniref:hypothetical protein n=1 Tax=Candidatus Amarolinea dominans TaxID=3140696 RepID=UPI003135B780|nr:hypothetical protein [Anaerolineae bacterium]
MPGPPRTLMLSPVTEAAGCGARDGEGVTAGAAVSVGVAVGGWGASVVIDAMIAVRNGWSTGRNIAVDAIVGSTVEASFDARGIGIGIAAGRLYAVIRKRQTTRMRAHGLRMA